MTADEPEAFAVIAGRVAAVGTIAHLLDQFLRAKLEDFGDRVVIPGFNDAHMHLAMTAEDLLHLDLSVDAVRSIRELQASVRSQAALTPVGGWIRGSRYDDGKMAEGRLLTRWDLDQAAPAHPVLVVHVAAHWGVMNTAGLRLAGIDDASVPPAGGTYGRDSSGRLNGILYEQALFDCAYPQLSRTGATVVPASSFEQKLNAVARACEMFHAAGLTSICDALVGPEDIRLLSEAKRRGLLTMRVNVLVAAERYDEVRRLGWKQDAGDAWLRMAGVKTFVDGAIGGRTCLLDQPFEGSSDDYGIQTRSTSELIDTVFKAHEDGTRICVHANGDRAIKLILDVIEEAYSKRPGPQQSHRIEHCSVVNEEILARMKWLRLTAVPFGSYVNYHGARLIDWYGESRLARMFAHRWFIDSEIPVAGSSDFPCGPYEPLLALQSCITRQGWDGSLIGANQRVAPIEALELYTTRAAAATGEESYKGMLRPGFVADFVILGGDPLTARREDVAKIPVLATYVDGQPVWSART